MKLAVALLLVGAFALNFSYDGEIFVAPGVDKTVRIYVQSVNESGFYLVACSSDISVGCPNYIQVEPGKEIEVPLSVQAKLGTHPVNVTIGDKLIEFTVKASNQTCVFYNTLARHNKTFSRLEAKYGQHHLLELGKLLLSEGFSLYEMGEYPAAGGIAGNLDNILGEYYASLQAPEVEEEPARLNLSLIPILLVGAMFALYVRATRKPKPRPGTGELSKLLQKESGGAFVGRKEENC
jgi:hypothetical protein